MEAKRYTIPIIVLAQFACTSLWFAGNAVIADIQLTLGLPASTLGHSTTAVQLGFIIGTLVFAIFTIADRFSPSNVFFICAIAGAITNLGIFLANDITGLLSARLLTGFFLAGIYPVGMKIASDYRQHGLNTALGWLVGALVFGTSFPHLLRFFSSGIPWKYVIIGTSVLAAFGGAIIYLIIPDGPFRKQSTSPDFKKFFLIFKNKSVREPALGYVGHMWELYSFWTFVPVAISYYINTHSLTNINTSFWSFVIIGVGGVGCIAGGYFAQRIGSSKTATYSLAFSGLCCVLSPFLFSANLFLFISFLLFWGFMVVADSPQFSTLVASGADKQSVGTALTIVNSIGFAITIVSIQVLSFYSNHIEIRYLFLVLFPGPLLGVWAMRRNFK